MFRPVKRAAVWAVLLCMLTVAGLFTVSADAELPGYASFAVEVLEADYDESVPAEDQLGDLAQAYIDNYDTAIQEDTDVKANAEEAISVIRQNGSGFFASFWSILPPIIAIILALITKEVYSSLFIGILAGGLLYANFNLVGTLEHVTMNGFVASLSDSDNVGILIFLVLLGALVSMMNKAGGSRAFGEWASKHIKTRVGAQIATIVLGILIFVDDYFNCLTVGSVMRPVTDAKQVSRAKLAYLIDATAAPICIIAPISSWAAAVAGFASSSDVNGFGLFISAIPYNFYAILTIVMMFVLAIDKFDYGPMKKHEMNALLNDDLYTSGADDVQKSDDTEKGSDRGIVIDLVIPVIILIICCVTGMIYSGGYFDPSADGYRNIMLAFSQSDASVGLALGSLVAVIIDAIYFMLRGVLTFTSCMSCLPEGFKAMVPAILILTFAWTLKGMTDSLGAKIFIADIVNSSAQSFISLLPALIFLIAVGLSFATGTSWGTFGILIPIVLSAFSGLGGLDNSITIIAISACMAGAVCGDHCSPISDTTIMASAGARCNHLNHVSTQLPYALTVAAVSFVSYIIAGFVKNAYIALPISIVLMVATLFIIKVFATRKSKNK